MNILDKTISYFAPEAALRRIRARAGMAAAQALRGGFEAGRTDWRGSSWHNGPSGPNTQLFGDLPIVRRRARDLVRNNPLAKKSLEALVAHTIGSGIRPSWNTESKAQRARLKDAWERFVDTADARRQTTLYGLQEQAVRGMYEAGETLALRQRSPGKGLQFALIESECLDHQRDGVIVDDGYMTRLGVAIEKDGYGVAGYYLYERHPDDQGLFGVWPYSKFVAADGILHLYRIRRPGQVRGVPELAASISVMRDLADYTEAAIVKARVEACFGAFIESEDLGAANVGTRVDNVSGADGSSHDVVRGELSPGMIARLRPGEKIAFGQPSSQSDFSSFMLHGAMSAAAGMGVTYDQATGDLRQANYSSLRAGKIEFRRSVEMIQKLTVIPQFCAPLYREFLAFERDFGSLREADVRVGVKWITPAWEPIDPVKDLSADILAVRAGRLSWPDFVASWGEDPVEQLEEIKRFNASADAAGIILDTDPRHVSAGGQKHAEPAEPDGDEAVPKKG